MPACVAGYSGATSLVVKLLARFPLLLLAAAPAFGAPYDDIIGKDKPAAYWNSNPAATQALLRAGAELGDGPRPPEYPQFIETNHAVLLGKPGASLRIPDPGADSIYDFKKGDSITLEAWVRCDQIGNGQNSYIVGKAAQAPARPAGAIKLGPASARGGRTARVSFVFRDERGDDGQPGILARWTAHGFLPAPAGTMWRSTFGKPDSVRGSWMARWSAVNGTWRRDGARPVGG